ncbi:hypothetical protein [Bradyrhizobium liaoningense]|uniref:hypothetical protein n=1 Tax=Bradyrhizobium liaoningense TaxID=43992 RepID=UPI001BA783CB|nr:hypothetical protein [Bradyrhizobium liaoningense]MBR0714773.1 hypothetical protein [Bradyrhizobium liaoningense]
MPQHATDAYDAQMWAYRDHLRGLNRRLAEDYARENIQHVVVAIEELAQAAPVTLAIAELHEAIRRSPAKNFWPVIRRTKGVLLLRSPNVGEGCPWPWQRTNSGNLRYRLPGHLLFSPWPPNVRRSVRNRTLELQRMIDRLQALPDISHFLDEVLAGSIQYKTRQAIWLINGIKALQGIAMPDSIAALDRWSDKPRPDSNVVLRISRGALVYHDGPDRCEIEIPAALTKPLRVPSTHDRALERHLVRAGPRSYYP